MSDKPEPVAVESTTTPDHNDPKKTNYVNYIIWGLVVVCVLFSIYYAYSSFIANAEIASGSDRRIKIDSDDNDQIASNYNLRAEVEEIETMQESINKTLTEDIGM